MTEQSLGPGRIVLVYVPDPHRADHPVTPFPAIVVEVDPETDRPTLHPFFPWGRQPGDGTTPGGCYERVERVVEGESRAWRWDWPVRS
jgi:hypothetical protein